jgi:hypothetical protein
MDEFPYLADHAERLAHIGAPLTDEELLEILCSDCGVPADARAECDCGSFHILRRLLDTGRITAADIVSVCQ